MHHKYNGHRTMATFHKYIFVFDFGPNGFEANLTENACGKQFLSRLLTHATHFFYMYVYIFHMN